MDSGLATWRWRPDMTRQALRTPPSDAYLGNGQCIKTPRNDAYIRNSTMPALAEERHVSVLHILARLHMRRVGRGRPHLEVHHVCDRARETANLVVRNRVQFCLKIEQSHREQMRRVVERHPSRLSGAALKPVDQGKNLLGAIVHRLLLSNSALVGVSLIQLLVVTISP